MSKKVQYEDDDLIVSLEWADGEPYIHHDIYNWNKTTFKKLIVEVDKLCSLLTQLNYDVLWSYYPKTNTTVKKFCDYFGFKQVGETEDSIVVMKELICQ
jgi:hypothetical protein